MLTKAAGLMDQVRPTACPCCGQPVAVLDPELIITAYSVPKQEAAILRAVWKGRGRGVPTERIFDAMYADDPDGGPSADKMYRAFKVALHHLRRRIAGSAVSIENVGYARGYRLVLNAKETA